MMKKAEFAGAVIDFFEVVNILGQEESKICSTTLQK